MLCFNFLPENICDVIIFWLYITNVFFLFLSCNRINKRGSQKDAEQKKNGNYFFYDDEGGDGDDDDDFDDI